MIQVGEDGWIQKPYSYLTINYFIFSGHLNEIKSTSFRCGFHQKHNLQSPKLKWYFNVWKIYYIT